MSSKDGAFIIIRIWSQCPDTRGDDDVLGRLFIFIASLFSVWMYVMCDEHLLHAGWFSLGLAVWLTYA
jgi:hypothetical protein